MTLMIKSWCDGGKCDPCKKPPQLPGGPWPATAPDNAVQVSVYAFQNHLDASGNWDGGFVLTGIGGFFIGQDNQYVNFPTPLKWNWGPTPIDSPSYGPMYYFVFLSYGGTDHPVGNYATTDEITAVAQQFQTYWWG